MAASKNDLSRYSDIFSKKLPGTTALFIVLILISIVVGIASVALLHYETIRTGFDYILVNGTLGGLVALLLPTVLTVILIKAIRYRINIKHLLFIAMVGAVSYSIFLLLGSILHIVFGSPAATITILVGAASLFGWWFFISKVVLNFRKRSIIVALIQPTLNIVLFVGARHFFFTFNRPLGILFLKLYVGIFIFMIVSYILLYMFDRPLKKNLGVGSIDLFSSMLQSWLFNINTALPFSTKLGIRPSVDTNTLVVRNEREIKAVLFIPEIHYGPAGNLGASDFPNILERQIRKSYKAFGFVMHPTVNADRNPIAFGQINKIRAALYEGVAEAKRTKGGMSYSVGRCGPSRVIKLSFDGVSLITFTRAPRVTEDVAYDVSTLFKKTLSIKYGNTILIDAHNSRYESAPKSELDGVRFDSSSMKDYMKAIDSIKELHSAKECRVGVRGVELYDSLRMPKDIGRGDLNVAVFSFGSFKYAILQFNSNNILPSLRNEIVSYLRRKYKIEAEVYTTDTHSVNSLEWTVENVLGRYTKFRKLQPLIDKAVSGAIKNIEPVKIYHKKVVMEKFPIWGPEVGDTMVEMTKSIVARARVLSPIIIVSGFIVAALLISLV
ncbi:MAG TPA: DUF2070 family protein [Candidatus Acidoferrum sp.]|nr:DUF2070 family protein [Candidatus Acidoferrum sp.]